MTNSWAVNNRSFVLRLWSAAWAPLALLVLHSALTAALGHQRQYDPVFHFLGGAAGAYCLLHLLGLFQAGVAALKGLNPSVVVLAVMLAVTIVWELLEFASDRLLGSHIQLGAGDTSSDILLGMFGALCVIGLVRVTERRPGAKAAPKQ